MFIFHELPILASLIITFLAGKQWLDNGTLLGVENKWGRRFVWALIFLTLCITAVTSLAILLGFSITPTAAGYEISYVSPLRK